MARKTDKTEKDLAALVDDVGTLKFGYIGNFESWGDDRRLHIWITNMEEENGNHMTLWSCEARDFNDRAYYQAVIQVKTFALGAHSALKAIGQV